MKKATLLLVLVAIIFSCSSNNEPDHVDPEPTYNIEGKWLWSPNPEDRTYANTMYEFVNSVRYTSYANCTTENPCTDEDFNALDAADRIPGTKSYTWDYDTQTITYEDGSSSEVIFECDGGIWVGSNGERLWRLSSDCQ